MGRDDLLQRVWSWAFDVALPKWARIGFYADHGGAVEALTHDGRRAADEPFIRVRVVARQIYVFSHAAALGWRDGEALAARAFGFLAARRLPDGGWPRRLTRAGDVLDSTPDLYDIAFVLFALGWRIRVAGDPEATRLAAETLSFLEARLRHPGGRGFLNASPSDGPRLQNPHMHLLEAALVCFDATGDARYARLAEELIDLFETRFFDPVSGSLGEYFDENWSRAPGELGRHVEPGHMFEWAWILAQGERLLGGRRHELVRRLVETAERMGVDPASGLVVNLVRDDGVPLDRGSRAWPNTERIKGWLALFELTGADPSGPVCAAAAAVFDHYLAHPEPGAWIDRIDADGRPVPGLVPASTFYHVFLAFAELIRLGPALRAKGFLAHAS